MRYAAVLGTVALTELLAHFLSLGWGLMTLLAAFAWVALSGASTAAKARSTEDRVAALVPVVGTAYTTANAAQATANNALPKTGGTVSGSLAVNGDHHVGGSLYGSGGNLNVGDSVYVNGSHTVTGSVITFSGYTGASIHVTGNAQADGQVSTFQMYVNGTRLNMRQSAGGWPISSGQAWGPSVVNVLNQLAAAANNTGAFST